MGMKKENIVIADIGSRVEVNKHQIRLGESFGGGTRYVDGVSIDGSESVVLRDRIHLSEDGMIAVVVCISERSGDFISTDIVNKGIELDGDIIEQSKLTVCKTVKEADVKVGGDNSVLKNQIRRNLKNYIFKKTKKNPMILPVIMEV